MPSPTSFLPGLFFVLFLANAAHSAESVESAKPRIDDSRVLSRTPQQSTGTGVAPPVAAPGPLSGVVQTFYPHLHKLTIIDDNGQTRTVIASDRTSFTAGSRPGSFSDIRRGDFVVVTYGPGGEVAGINKMAGTPARRSLSRGTQLISSPDVQGGVPFGTESVQPSPPLGEVPSGRPQGGVGVSTESSGGVIVATPPQGGMILVPGNKR